MSDGRTPWFALSVLRCFGSKSYSESLEGDLLEEFDAGRSSFWVWRQVFGALFQRVRCALRRQIGIFLAVTAFFILALWAIAPATYPVVTWARSAEPLRTLVLLGWLMGVPLLLGGVAGAAENRRHLGVILPGFMLAYLTPVTQPFAFAVCDLCAAPGSTTAPATAVFMTPLGSALLAGFGAWVVGRFRHKPQELHR